MGQHAEVGGARKPGEGPQNRRRPAKGPQNPEDVCPDFRQTHTDRHTHTQRHTETQRDTETHRDTQRDTETHRDTQRHTETHRDTQRHAETHRDTERHRETQRDTERHRETHRDTERHRESQRDTERHRQTQRDTERHRETQRHTETHTHTYEHITQYTYACTYTHTNTLCTAHTRSVRGNQTSNGQTLRQMIKSSVVYQGGRKGPLCGKPASCHSHSPGGTFAPEHQGVASLAGGGPREVETSLAIGTGSPARKTSRVASEQKEPYLQQLSQIRLWIAMLGIEVTKVSMSGLTNSLKRCTCEFKTRVAGRPRTACWQCGPTRKADVPVLTGLRKANVALLQDTSTHTHTQNYTYTHLQPSLPEASRVPYVSHLVGSVCLLLNCGVALHSCPNRKASPSGSFAQHAGCFSIAQR